MRTTRHAAPLLALAVLAGCAQPVSLTTPDPEPATARAHQVGPSISDLDARLSARWLHVSAAVDVPAGGNVQVFVNADGLPTGYTHGFEFVVTGDGSVWCDLRATEGEPASPEGWGPVVGRALVRYEGRHLNALLEPLGTVPGGKVRAWVHDAEGVGFARAEVFVR